MSLPLGSSPPHTSAMFPIHNAQYAYVAPPSTTPRHLSGQNTSSAFSASANPDEDWTKISDLAERRRIQNRIAQRNYRKKLKKRLEDLERRAADGSSPPGNTSPKQSGSGSGNRRSQPKVHKQNAQQHQQVPKHMAPGPFTPPMQHDEYDSFASVYEGRDRSHTPPMFAPYSSYPPPPEDMLMAPYGTAAAAAAYGRPLGAVEYPEYVTTSAPVSVTLPSLSHFHDALSIKRETGAGHYVGPGGPLDAGLAPYGTLQGGYSGGGGGYLTGVDMSAGAPSPYDHMPHTPPLSHSFDHSTTCSESGSYEYPTTPLSLPPSPPIHAGL